LDEEKQLQSIASMLFFTPLWSFCIFLPLDEQPETMEDET
jgi:hypothetical protein